ncbi:MAG: hypothetical protein KME52_17345 [Desmonostoc geniculatum HA4340-LM1]|nr:hypothetical protein [Desmonostoc geniculatum HA4340-LM1]
MISEIHVVACVTPKANAPFNDLGAFTNGRKKGGYGSKMMSAMPAAGYAYASELPDGVWEMLILPNREVLVILSWRLP